MDSLRILTDPSLLTSASILCSCLLITYIFYMHFMHPLSNFPGPLLPSLTSAWKAYYVYKLTLHERLVELHEQYGPVVRVGPNHLHFWDGEAIAPIYKGGRKMGKTEFYDAFTAFKPNLFGGRDEDIHSLRRRQLSHGFSQNSVQNFEHLIDDQMSILKDKLGGLTETGEIFDLKNMISYYVLDILGEVAFGHPFDAQIQHGSPHLPAIEDHLFLSGVIGELPFQRLNKLLARYSPIPWMRRLVKSRNALKLTCAECVGEKICHSHARADLLQSLVHAKDPATGANLTEEEINSEAFAMLVAGSHSTAGTLTLVFWHLVHHPDILDQAQQELSSILEPLQQDQIAYPIRGLEASLPFTMACIRENFRINPVFTMPLWRQVHSPGGADIANIHVPHGTNVAISNYVLHHNPDIWGSDHNTFNPNRWLGGKEGISRYLIPFSIGHRMCIGRNLAMTNIIKTVTTLLSEFELHPESKEREVCVRSSGIGEMEGPFLCRVSMRA